MTQEDFIPNNYANTLTKGQVSFQSPSNIALIKYWGKYGIQLPKNTSISFTLSECHTKTTLSYEKKDTKGYDFEVYLDEQRERSFEPKVLSFFERIEKYLPFLEDYTFIVKTTNSFPHSSGIASSASGMSALALCLMQVENKLLAMRLSEVEFQQKASFLARLGSGSACRSIEGPLVVWGEHAEIEKSSHLFGTSFPYDVHPNFKNYQDTILLVDKGEKQVSSTVGHDLMYGHPFAEQRFTQANDNITKMITVLASGDFLRFIEIVESEALSLHAMMMTSMPYFILMKPNTLEIINRIWAFRKRTKSNVCFTLDAGANVHVLYPFSEKENVQQFIAEELASFCKNEEYIHDAVGLGATSIQEK